MSRKSVKSALDALATTMGPAQAEVGWFATRAGRRAIETATYDIALADDAAVHVRDDGYLHRWVTYRRCPLRCIFPSTWLV
jgi:hypothetical protein